MAKANSKKELEAFKTCEKALNASVSDLNYLQSSKAVEVEKAVKIATEKAQAKAVAEVEKARKAAVAKQDKAIEEAIKVVDAKNEACTNAKLELVKSMAKKGQTVVEVLKPLTGLYKLPFGVGHFVAVESKQAQEMAKTKHVQIIK